MISIFVLIACALFTISSYMKKESIEDFSSEYIDQYSTFVVKEFCDTLNSCVKATNILSSWVYDQQITENVFDQTTDYSNILSKKPDKQMLSFLKQVICSFDGLVTMQIANSSGNFWQIRHYTEANNLPIDKIKMQTSNDSIPPNTSYAFRMTTGALGNLTNEEWDYYSEDETLIKTETSEFSQYVANKRDWYLNAISSQNSRFISDIYNSGSTVEVPVLTISSTLQNIGVFPDAEKNCVVSADISSKFLENLLKAKSFSKNNIICIVDDKNSLIINSQHGEIKQNNNFGIYEKNDVLVNTLNIYNSSKNKEDYFSFLTNDIKYVANFTAFPNEFEIMTGKQWKMLIISPIVDLEEKFSKYNMNGNIVYIILILVALMQIICISRRLADPISDLTDEALKIYKFDFSSDFHTDSKILEITKLDNVIRSMRISLKSFTKYMPKSLVIKLLDKTSNIELGGEVKNVSIFFSDIENFTTVSEKLSASELSLHISDYFDHLTKILMNENATIDKYIGDSIMAFWGAPDDDDKRSFHSCRAALLCQHEIIELNKKWAANNLPILNTRMGIHTGNAVVGNIGSSDRINYTLLGDSVNLASRLEGTNKIYKTKIIISQFVNEEVKKYFLTMPLDIVAVKGKSEPIKIYELIGQYNADIFIRPTTEQIEFAKIFTRAFDFYINMNWEGALNILNNINLEEDNKYTLLIDMYKDRCSNFLKTPPDENWNGTIKLTTK